MSSVWFRSSCISAPSYFNEGSVHVASSLKELEMCTAKVSSLCIYQKPLHLPKPLQVVKALSHDFLVVDVSAIEHPSQGDLRGLMIRAEKSAPNENGENTGILLQKIHFVQEENFTKRYFKDGLNVSVPVGQLLKILTKHCADYDILNDNCWLYAENTLRALVQEFRDLQPEVGDAMNASLQQISCRPMPGTVVGYITSALAIVTGVYVYIKLSACAEDEVEKKEE